MKNKYSDLSNDEINKLIAERLGREKLFYDDYCSDFSTAYHLLVFTGIKIYSHPDDTVKLSATVGDNGIEKIVTVEIPYTARGIAEGFLMISDACAKSDTGKAQPE